MPVGITPTPHPAKAVCAARRLTYTQIGADLGFHPHFVGRILNGIARPTPRFRRELARYLDLPETELFHETDATERKIAELLAAAPPLSDEQRARLRQLLAPVKAGTTREAS